MFAFPLQPRADLSTGLQQKDTTFYEFRTYCIRPEQNAAFLKLTNEKIHLRTAHSELIGYWSVEYGGLNKVFHIWRYGKNIFHLLKKNLSHSSEVRRSPLPLLRSPPFLLLFLRKLFSAGGRSGSPGSGPRVDYRIHLQGVTNADLAGQRGDLSRSLDPSAEATKGGW